MLLNARYILVLALMLAFFLSLSVHAEDATSEELPEYCADYPVIEGELDSYRDDLSSREGEVSHILCHEDQNISVGVTDILTHWSDVQENQYDDIREAFEEKLRKGVFRNLAMSTYFYRDVYGPNCDELELSSGLDRETQSSECFEQWGMAPSCGEDNEDFEDIFNQIDSDYATYREQAAQELIEAEESEADEEEAQEHEQTLTEAFEILDEKKKLSFVKKHVENIMHLSFLREEIEDGQGHSLEDEQGERLAELYRQTPLLFENEDENLTSDFEVSGYAHQLQEKFISAQNEGEEISSENIQDFLASQEGQEIINVLASDSELESLAEEAVANEIRNKRSALEDICKGDVENLHRFPSLVEQVMSESIEGGEVSEVVADQAAYCYMLQAPFLEAEDEQRVNLMANPITVPFGTLDTGILMMNTAEEDENLGGGEELANIQQFTSTEEAYRSSSSWEVDQQDEASPQEEINIPKLLLRVVGQGSQNHIEVAGDQAEFEVEAYFEDDSIEVPLGSFHWECIPPDGDGNEGLCEDSGYSESGESQSVKLFNRVPYVLKADYVVEDGYYPLYVPSAPLRVTLEMECETNERGTQCVSDGDSREVTNTDEDDVEQERIREPFWWESLPSNAPPPQFKPGPPMQMRTFILPGAV